MLYDRLYLDKKDKYSVFLGGNQPICVIENEEDIKNQILNNNWITGTRSDITIAPEDLDVKVLSYKGNIFGVEPPTFVELEVVYTEPGIKGSTATGTTKPAKVETGVSFNVPIFVEIGDVIRIDTRTGEYMERV